MFTKIYSITLLFSKIHAIWHKQVENQRPLVLSIGHQQLKQDMRYRVKEVDLNHKLKRTILDVNTKNYINNNSFSTFNSHSQDEEYPINNTSNKVNFNETDYDQVTLNTIKKTKYLIQNWQFEIRKLTYDDSGTYTCLLPLVKPITKNVTLQVIRRILYFYNFLFKESN